MRIAESVIYFYKDAEKSQNGGDQVATAYIVNRKANESTRDLVVFNNSKSTPQHKAGVYQATNREDAVLGGKYCTIEQALAWGIDLENEQELTKK